MREGKFEKETKLKAHVIWYSSGTREYIERVVIGTEEDARKVTSEVWKFYNPRACDYDYDEPWPCVGFFTVGCDIPDKNILNSSSETQLQASPTVAIEQFFSKYERFVNVLKGWIETGLLTSEEFKNICNYTYNTCKLENSTLAEKARIKKVLWKLFVN